MEEVDDPWKVQSLYELQFFNCPGCIYRSKSKQEFVNHIYGDHPEAIITLRNVKDDSLNDIENPLVDSKPKSKGVKRKMGKPTTPFMSASPALKRRKLNPDYKNLKSTCKKQDIPFCIALGQMGSRYYHNVDPSLHKLFNSIASGENPIEPKVFSEAMSKYIKSTLGIGQDLWDWLRSILLPSVVFTARSKLQAYTIKNNAPKESFNNGFWISLDYALPITIKELLELKESFKPSTEKPESLELYAKIVPMYDGSGSHVQMQGDDIDISTRNLIIIGFRVVMIVDKHGNLIHLEQNQSEETFRTIGLCPGKEDATGGHSQNLYLVRKVGGTKSV